METQDEFILYTWLKGYGLNVWINRKTKYTNNTFTTKGKNQKPDIIVQDQEGKYVAIEVKNNVKNKDVYNAVKIIRYRENYEKKTTKYFIEGKEIEIKSFLVATRYSLTGQLFSEPKSLINEQEYPNHPKREYPSTKVYTRILWAINRENKENKKCGIGVLLSGVLDNPLNSHPYKFSVEKENNAWGVVWKPM